MNNLLIIDKENSKYLVRPTLTRWICTACYHKPKRSSKGYVGSKSIIEDKINILPDYEANVIEFFEKYKSKYEKQLETKEIIGGFVNCYPDIRYYVTCPVCGNDAEIVTFMMLLDAEGESMVIDCQHCKNDLKQVLNKVGVCYDTSFFMNKEELDFRQELDVNQMKWDEWKGNNKNG